VLTRLSAFRVMSITTSCNVLTYMSGKPFIRGVMTNITNAMSSVVATRLLLNVRRVRRFSLSESLSTSTSIMRNDIWFTSAIVSPEPSFVSEQIVGYDSYELEELRRVYLK